MDGIQEGNSGRSIGKGVFDRNVRDALLNVARRALAASLRGGDGREALIEIDEDIRRFPPCARVNVTIRTYGKIRASMSGDGARLIDQIFNAAYRCLKDDRFNRLVASDEKSLDIELWIQESAETIDLDSRTDSRAIDLGLHGVEIEWNDAFAYFKPSVPLTSGFRTPQEVFKALCRKAELFEDAWRQEACTLRRTKWVHICGGGSSHSYPLIRLRQVVTHTPSKRELISLLQQCTSYLANNQHSDGSYCYQWNPLTGASSQEGSNSVRASGCAYAMALAASSCYFAGIPVVGQSARRAIECILENVGPWKGGLLVRERASGDKVWGKLGSTALLAASMTARVFNGHFEKQREALFQSIANAQEANGSFCCNPGSGRADGKGIDYYPGEALVALLLSAEVGDRQKLKLVDLAFKYYSDHFRMKPTTAFVGWHAEAWSRAASLCGNSDYAAFVFEQVDWLIGLQLTDGAQDGLNGGFITQTGAAPSVSSVVYTEAVVRGLATARRLGDAVRMDRYKKSAIAGLRFCLQLIVSREQAAFLEEPDRAYGGVTGSLQTFGVRADHVQHTITLLLATLELAAFLDIA